jgi:hypothetical protein
MALIANLGDLESAISEWLGRAGDVSLAARADEFIALFEADFALDPEMRLVDMQEIDTATLVSASITLPTGYLEMTRFKVLGSGSTPDQVLDYVTPAQAGRMDTWSQASTGGAQISKYFTEIAGQLVVTPQKWAPLGATVELVYYKFTQLKDSVGGVNWLLQKFPQIYLYGSLMQAAAYIDDKATTGQWASGLQTAMLKLAKADARRKTGSGPLIVRPSTGFIR